MIALPFHPSNVYSIRELCRDRAYLDGVLESVEKDAYMRSGLTYTLRDKIKNKRLMVQQASIAGCAGGTFDNIAAAADILDGYKISGDGISLGIYPASQPVFWKLCGREWLNVSCCQELPYGRVSAVPASAPWMCRPIIH